MFELTIILFYAFKLAMSVKLSPGRASAIDSANESRGSPLRITFRRIFAAFSFSRKWSQRVRS